MRFWLTTLGIAALVMVVAAGVTAALIDSYETQRAPTDPKKAMDAAISRAAWISFFATIIIRLLF